jgi:hypothetical protein
MLLALCSLSLLCLGDGEVPLRMGFLFLLAALVLLRVCYVLVSSSGFFISADRCIRL